MPPARSRKSKDSAGAAKKKYPGLRARQKEPGYIKKPQNSFMLFQNELKADLKAEREKLKAEREKLKAEKEKLKAEKEKEKAEKAEKGEEVEEAEKGEEAEEDEKQGGAEVAKMASKLWKELSDDRRESYEEQARVIKEAHEKAHPELRKQLPKAGTGKGRQDPSAFYPTPDQTPAATPGPSTPTPSRSGSETTNSLTTSSSTSSSTPAYNFWDPYSACDLPCPGAASHPQSTSRTHPPPARALFPASGQLAGPSHERYSSFQALPDALSSLSPATIQPTAPSYSNLPFNGIFPTTNHADRVDQTTQFMNRYHNYYAHPPPALPPMVQRTSVFTSQNHEYGYFLPPPSMQGHTPTPSANAYSALFGLELPQHEPSLYSQPTVHAGLPSDMSARTQVSMGFGQTMSVQANHTDTAAIADAWQGRPYSSQQFPSYHANLAHGYGHSMASHWTPQTSLENYQDVSTVHYGYSGTQYTPPADLLGFDAYNAGNAGPAFSSQPGAHQPESEQERAELPAFGVVPSDTANQVEDQGVEASIAHFLQTIESLFDSEHPQDGYNPGL